MNDNEFMELALSLAEKGVGQVEPNPMVGCVIVKDDKIIGRGWHEKFGGPHAEVNAIADCRKNGCSPEGSTVYVTLEPCSHFGKTPPCADALIEAKVAKVIAAMVDPSKHVAGKGIEKLRAAGIEVGVGLCEEKARALNAPFIKFAETGKCWVIVKWAQSKDGKLSWSPDSGQRWISNEKSRADAHKIRRSVQAILVGVDTVIADDPLLTPRPSDGRKPARIVLDTHLRIPLDCKLLSTAKDSPVLIVTTNKAIDQKPDLVNTIKKAGAEILIVPLKNNTCDITELLKQLAARQIVQLLVEGGAKVITSFLENSLADEMVVYISDETLGQKGCVDITEPMKKLTARSSLTNAEITQLDNNTRIRKLI